MSARDLALYELDRRQLPGWTPDLLRKPLNPLRSDPRDLGLSEQITFGVIQNHLHLLWLIEHYSRRKLPSIDELLQKILSIGIYQLRFLDRVPISAAVNEAVEQTKRMGRTKAAGFINAVMRRATREPAPPPPDRKADPSTYAELMLSHPRELFARFSKLLGPADALRLCMHDNQEPPTIIRLFPGVDISQLQSPLITLTPHEQPGLYVVEPAKRATLADWAQRGLAQVQDPTAAKVAVAVKVGPGQTVLDRCAGLGTKTQQLRDALGHNGRLVAMDPAHQRITALKSLIASRDFKNVIPCEAGTISDVPELAGVHFDRVLADVPCSNSGVLPRRPEARYAQTTVAMQSLIRLQQQILDDTAPRVKPGGLLVYSTCSVWPEENQEQMARFLQRHPAYSMEAEQVTLPSLDLVPTRYRDGGYFAVLKRSAS